jgi:hypothetical protein
MAEEEKTNPPKTTGNLFTDLQISVATFIGMPIAGCLLLAQNYRNLGRASSAWKTLILGLVSTIILFFIAFQLPESFPNAVLPMVYTVAMRQLVKYLQGDIIVSQQAQGKKGSWAVTVGIAIGCLILIMALAVGAIFLFVPE